MDSPIVVSLVISGIGMTLLFLALLLFYFLLTLLTKAVREKRSLEQPILMTESAAIPEVGARERAAILGVALARASVQAGVGPAAGALPGDSSVPGRGSPWWDLHHTRRLVRGGPSRRNG